VQDETLPAIVQIERAIQQLQAKGYDISNE
jgi:hypothetical protein